MASAQFLLLSLVVMAATGAPQFGDDSDEQPTPYDFAYGVNVPDTGDAKEHKESVSPSGRTEGEYRWRQPNGLYMVVRYIIDGDSGFQADVNEEPGTEIANYYTNTLSQQSSSGPAVSQGFAKSIDVGRPAVNVIATPQPSFTPSQAFTSQSFSNVIDGGIIDGGIIDGGIIDGGIIDGGIIDGGFIDDSFENDSIYHS
ncbi:cuticle protein 16.8-like [Panulirus ornatus]|uniref:cuticle protein 16.8-like n=1 Tax=Panulirus ornatus TaxID=150431 RepID=UPI003A8C5D48